MKILDRYILFHFFCQLILWYISLVGIYLVLDLFQNIDTFFQLDGECDSLTVFLTHYFFISTSFIDVVLPLLMVMSALSSIAMMIRRCEVIALLAMGVSELRIMAPILCGAVLLSITATGVREIFLPRNMENISRTVKEQANPSQGIKLKQTTDGRTRIKIDGERYFPQERRINKPTIILPARYFGLSIGEIKADSAQWQDATSDRPSGFLLDHVTKPDGLTKQPSIVLKNINQRVILMPKDTPWLKEGQCFVVTGIELELLVAGSGWISYTSTLNLIRQIRDPSCDFSRQNLAVRIHTRILRPLTDMFPLLIGLPVIFLRNDQNVFKALAMGGLLAAIFIGIQYASLFLGGKSNMPVLAAWLPILIFGPIVANLFARNYR